jgi:hypothetical protein
VCSGYNWLRIGSSDEAVNMVINISTEVIGNIYAIPTALSRLYTLTGQHKKHLPPSVIDFSILLILKVLKVCS